MPIVNLNVVLKDMDDTDMIEMRAPPKGGDAPIEHRLTVRDVVLRALDLIANGDESLSFTERMKRYELSKRIKRNPEKVRLEPEAVEVLRDAIEKQKAVPLVQGQIMDVIHPGRERFFGAEDDDPPPPVEKAVARVQAH